MLMMYKNMIFGFIKFFKIKFGLRIVEWRDGKERVWEDYRVRYKIDQWTTSRTGHVIYKKGNVSWDSPTFIKKNINFLHKTELHYSAFKTISAVCPY